MAKRTFSTQEWFHLTELAHAAVLGGLVAARRWSLGDLKFQGGTSLHLVYGSPRFSEDLDFVTASPKGLKSAMHAAGTHVKAAFAREFPQMTTSLKVRDEEEELEPRNPRLFTLTLSEPDWHQSLKVKVEFFIVEKTVAQDYQSAVQEVLPLRPKLRVDIPQVQLETAELEEILVDKLHALGDRDRLKERDVFDLQWVCNHLQIDHERAAEIFTERHEAHLAMYPNGKPLPELAESLRLRAAALRAILDSPSEFSVTREAIVRWLPGDRAHPNPLATESNVRAMVGHAARCADATACAVEELVESELESDQSVYTLRERQAA